MSDRASFLAAALAATSAAALTATPAMGFGGNNGTVCPQPVGPDVIVGDMQGVANFSAEQVPAGSGNWYDAFSFATYSCNIGNMNVKWQAFSSNQHPAIAQGLYKVKTANGITTIEQVGQSWLKHGFTALTDNICGCGCSGTGGSVLGVGCADPYTASRNATQNGMGPKWQVDATSGYFPAVANPSFSGTTARRLRVKSSDMEASSANVRWFGECQYVTQDDAAWGNKNNNTSYREVTITGGPNEWSMSSSFPGLTQREKAVINAWKAVDPNVTLTYVTTPESPNPNAVVPTCCTSALVIIGARVTDLGNNTWHYEYAVQNVNSDRAIGSFTVPLQGPVTITNVGFHDVDYHSGDGIGNVNRDGADWPATITSDSITWATVPFATNQNSNAIRWGTIYNFRFNANTPPINGKLSLGMYKVVSSVDADSVIPAPVTPPPSCPADVTGDHNVNVSDLLMVINGWGACPGRAACSGDANNDGQVNVSDLLMVINGWGVCP